MTVLVDYKIPKESRCLGCKHLLVQIMIEFLHSSCVTELRVSHDGDARYARQVPDVIDIRN